VNKKLTFFVVLFSFFVAGNALGMFGYSPEEGWVHGKRDKDGDVVMEDKLKPSDEDGDVVMEDKLPKAEPFRVFEDEGGGCPRPRWQSPRPRRSNTAIFFGVAGTRHFDPSQYGN